MMFRSDNLYDDDASVDDPDGDQERCGGAYPQDFTAGDRMCAPQRSERGSSMLAASLVVGCMTAAGWAVSHYPPLWQTLANLTSRVTEPTPATSPLAEAPPPLPPAAEVAPRPGSDGATDSGMAGGAASPSDPGTAETSAEVANAKPPAASDITDAAPVTEQSVEAGSEPQQAETPEPLSAPVADPNDPNQARALAAGLHPDLSRALLAQLTTADYSAARKAIRTALAETSDDQSFIWPREAGAQRAQFEVKFVQSAATGCRRYVVIVSKNRWSTTAPPMETCGSDLPKRSAARKPARKPG